VPQAQVSVNQFDERQRRQVAQTVAAEAEKTLKRDIQNKAVESRAAATAAAKENQFKCHYCQEKGHWLRDCPKKTADVKQAARQRAQQARQASQASQANGYGRQFGSSSQFSMSSAYQHALHNPHHPWPASAMTAGAGCYIVGPYRRTAYCTWIHASSACP